MESICRASAKPGLVGTCVHTPPAEGQVQELCAEHRALKTHIGSGVLCPGVEGQEEEMKGWKKAYVL